MDFRFVFLCFHLKILDAFVTNVGVNRFCLSPLTDISGFPINNSYDYIKSLLNFNCTHILGNLILFGLHPNVDGSDPDLSFLDSIREISGYLIIMNSSVSEIPLDNLQVIRGHGKGYSIHQDLPAAAVIIRHTFVENKSVKRIGFRSLRVIQNGDVFAFDNPSGCNLTPDVQWGSLFVHPFTQKYHNSTEIDLVTEESSYDLQCPSKKKPLGRCTRRSCAWCFREERNEEEHCCHEECLGGCTGPSASECFVCKNYRDGDTCVHACPPPVSLQNYDLALNVNFKYEFGGMCVSECQDGLMAELTRCVRECTPGKYYPFGNVCIPCEDKCPKVCTVTGALDGASLAELENCTTISGDLQITEESFRPSNSSGRRPITSTEELWSLHSVQVVNGMVYLDLRHLPTLLRNLTFLENLRKVPFSPHRYSIAILHDGIEFPGLYNLKEVPHGVVAFIESPKLCYVQTIVTASREVAKGLPFLPQIEFANSKIPSKEDCKSRGAICHASCEPSFGCWGPRRQDCIRCRHRSVEGSICVDSCDELPGYYNISINYDSSQAFPSSPANAVTTPPTTNPSSRRLLLARLAAGHYAMEEILYQHLPGHRDLEQRVFGKADLTCGRCHEECARGCSGPGADQCDATGCKHAKENHECVDRCSHTRYLDAASATCLPCHPSCHQRRESQLPVCSGPSEHPGPGGCNTCQKFLEFISFDGRSEEDQSRLQHGGLVCMHGPCGIGTYSTFETIRTTGSTRSQYAPYVESSVSVVPVCRSCHRLCSACNGYSVIRATQAGPGCLECQGYWFYNTCVASCPQDATFEVSLTYPPDFKKAYHFERSLDQESGLFVWRQLEGPVRGHSSHPRPALWSRHLAGACLACDAECRGGCWGPSASHCNRCAHFRVWHRGDVATLWIAPQDGIVYQLNNGQAGKSTPSAYFTCHSSCPPELQLASIDPLTGDWTCHAESTDSNAIYRERQLQRIRHAIVSVVAPLVALLMLFVIAVAIACHCRRRRKRGSPTFKRISRIFDKVLRIYDEPKGGQVYRMIPFGPNGGGGPPTEADNCLCSRSSSLYATANNTFNPPCSSGSSPSSGNTPCRYCHGISDVSPSSYVTKTYGNIHFNNQVYRRSKRQQPNMGRLILINLDDIRLPPHRRPLGSGAFGSVYKGVWRIPQENSLDEFDFCSGLETYRGADNRQHANVAVKILNESSGSGDLQALLEEAKVMCSVRHRNCLQLLGVCLAGSQRYLVSEYIPNGSLDCYLRRYKYQLPNELILLWADQIADGMAYLQSAGIIHRDLATRNVLVKRQDVVQITDFGLAKMLSGEEEVNGEVVVQSGRVPIRWLAIETLTSGRYSFKTDIWAFGVTLWEIFTFGQRPYAAIETADVKRFVLTGGRLSQPDICTLEAYQRLLLACWCENPDDRIAFVNVLLVLRSKSSNPEYFLHRRPTSSVISEETRISGVYSECARTDRDSVSPPSNGVATEVIQPPSSPDFTRGPSSAPQQRVATFRRSNPPIRVSNRETMETMSTTLDYSTPDSTDLEQPPAGNEERDGSGGGGGYVWPLPIAVPVYRAPANGNGPCVGEYVGPFFGRSSAFRNE